jgi:hypothetical protein
VTFVQYLRKRFIVERLFDKDPIDFCGPNQRLLKGGRRLVCMSQIPQPEVARLLNIKEATCGVPSIGQLWEERRYVIGSNAQGPDVNQHKWLKQ